MLKFKIRQVEEEWKAETFNESQASYGMGADASGQRKSKRRRSSKTLLSRGHTWRSTKRSILPRPRQNH